MERNVTFVFPLLNFARLVLFISTTELENMRGKKQLLHLYIYNISDWLLIIVSIINKKNCLTENMLSNNGCFRWLMTSDLHFLLIVVSSSYFSVVR